MRRRDLHNANAPLAYWKQTCNHVPAPFVLRVRITRYGGETTGAYYGYIITQSHLRKLTL